MVTLIFVQIQGVCKLLDQQKADSDLACSAYCTVGEGKRQVKSGEYSDRRLAAIDKQKFRGYDKYRFCSCFRRGMPSCFIPDIPERLVIEVWRGCS